MEDHEAVDRNAEADAAENCPQLEKLRKVENDRPDDDARDVVPEDSEMVKLWQLGEIFVFAQTVRIKLDSPQAAQLSILFWTRDLSIRSQMCYHLSYHRGPGEIFFSKQPNDKVANNRKKHYSRLNCYLLKACL